MAVLKLIMMAYAKHQFIYFVYRTKMPRTKYVARKGILKQTISKILNALRTHAIARITCHSISYSSAPQNIR